MQPKKIALLIREASLDKKAENPIILDLQKHHTIAAYFVVIHGNSHPHVKAIADHITVKIEENGMRVLHVEGMEDGLWVLLDLGSVIVHIFHRELRDFYSLERLWGDAKPL